MANYSRQRELLEQVLCSTTEHPTAATLYLEMRKVLPNVSLGTVYRNLKFLQEEGRAVRVPANQAEDRFDGNVAPHPHFVCEECGCVRDAAVPKKLDADIRYNCGEAEDYSLVYFGVCDKCRESNAESVRNKKTISEVKK